MQGGLAELDHSDHSITPNGNKNHLFSFICHHGWLAGNCAKERLRRYLHQIFFSGDLIKALLYFGGVDFLICCADMSFFAIFPVQKVQMQSKSSVMAKVKRNNISLKINTR